MSTSLKRQLAALAAPSSSLMVPDRRRASIIFTPQDAAKYDIETFYQIGQEGLSELTSINATLFSPFLKSVLFNEDSKKYERAVQLDAANQMLDKEISEFVITLYPYVMTNAALKCMEWLVYRFHIERFNVTAILQCILPYYDTKSFVMIVQALQIERFRENQEWEWLVPCIHSGAPLRKAVLFENSNSKFVSWLFSTFERILEVHREHPQNLRIYLGFMASTLVGILTKLKNELATNPKKVQNKKIIGLNILNKIFSVFKIIRENDKYKALKNNDEIYSMAYVVMGMLAVCCREIPGMTETIGAGLKQIFKLIVVNRGMSQLTETFLLLNLMIDFVHRDWVFTNPITFINIMKDVGKVSQYWDVGNLARKLFLFNLNANELLSPSKVFELTKSINLSPEVRSEILRDTFVFYRQHKRSWAKTFLTRFQRQYPVEFQMVNDKDESFAKDLVKLKTGKDFLMLSQHSSPLIRQHSVTKLIRRAVMKKDRVNNSKPAGKNVAKKFMKTVVTNKKITLDKNRTAVALTPRFGDDNEDVLVALLKPKLNKLLKIFTTGTLTRCLITVVKRNVALKPTRMALQKLCRIAEEVPESDEGQQQIMNVIVPFLFPRKKGQLKLTKMLLLTPFAQANKFLKRYSAVLKVQDVTAEQISSESFRLISSINDQHRTNLCSKIDTATRATFACLLLPATDLFDKLLPIVKTFDLVCCTTFPVNEANFPKCITVAKKRDKLSLELLLTALFRNPTTEFDHLHSIVKFVWKQAELTKNRDSARKFLLEYLKVCFNSEQEQYNFWLEILRRISSSKPVEDEGVENEFYLLRALQFVTAFVKGYNGDICDSASLAENELGLGAQNPDNRGRILRTRNQGKRASVDHPNIVQSNLNQHKATGTQLNVWELVELILSSCLTGASSRVRSCSLLCLDVIKFRLNEANNLRGFIDQVLQYKTEILTDQERILNVMGHLLNNQVIKSQILKSVTDANITPTRKLGLLKLCKYIGDQVFHELRPMIENLFATDPTSKVLGECLSFYNGSFDHSLLTQALSHKDMTKVVLKKIDRSAFEKYTTVQKNKIFTLLIDKTLFCENPEIKVAILRCVRKWILDVEIVANELLKCTDMERRKPSTNHSQKASELKKSANKAANLKDLNEDWTKRAEVVFEFIQGKKRLINKTKLILPLFKILKKCIALEEQIPVEYLKQLVLTSLTICCQEDDQLDEDETKDFVSFDVQTVIDCLRCSRNPQTHHHALILLHYAASRFHEQVLHGIMSLFTFMGNSILRQDDAYSTQLIQQTVVNIIPALAKTDKGVVHRLNVSAGIYRVFTSAVQDIPVHRRLPVFTSLVETLEPGHTLWQLCIVLVDNALQRDRKRSNLEADLELAVDLAWSFGPQIVMKTIDQMYSFLINLPVYSKNTTPKQFTEMKIRQSAMERSVLDFGRKESFRDILIVVNYVLELIAKLSAKFADTVAENVEYDTLLEKCLIFSKKVSGLNEEKLFRLIAHHNLDVIDKINAALNTSEFLEAIALILVRDDCAVKRKVIEIFNQRILQKVEWFGDARNLLDLVPILLQIAETEPETEEMITLVQTVFFSLKLLAKHLAIQHPDDFIPVFELASKYTGHKNRLLYASALLCLSELFCLKSLILPNLNNVTTAILKAFKASAKLQISGQDLCATKIIEGEIVATKMTEGENSLMTAHLLCISTLTCLNKMIEHLGSFVGMKFLKKVLTAVLSIKSTFGEGEKAGHRTKVFHQKLKILLKTISSKIPLRNIMQPIKETFANLSNDPEAVITLLKILKETLTQTSKLDFSLVLHSITDGFLDDFLQYREKMESIMDGSSSTITIEQVEQVEDSVIECLITGVILKMSESHFRPLYHKIFDWADEKTSRLVTFYRLSAAAAEKLKSLFVTFAGYVINKAILVMSEDVQLAKAIVRFFYHIFSNDKEGFVNTDRFNVLVQPLVDLVESQYVLEGEMKITEVNETIIQLAVATNDLNRWQHLIELISFKASHSNKLVRLHVLWLLEAAANELSKDFLPLLPPAVPFLAELMNDDDPEVESETQKLVLKLEHIVGEPLQSYFTS